jgi:hypothetical protein
MIPRPHLSFTEMRHLRAQLVRFLPRNLASPDSAFLSAHCAVLVHFVDSIRQIGQAAAHQTSRIETAHLKIGTYDRRPSLIVLSAILSFRGRGFSRRISGSCLDTRTPREHGVALIQHPTSRLEKKKTKNSCLHTVLILSGQNHGERHRFLLSVFLCRFCPLPY